ncbi:uncharacterized protein LOC118434938 isoform X3 [Folsomia candida]|uniref:uncharacterized protein LOC118434938 isoform X3 n=1 Tax=Folsomia candida TaxID=158441 RepID=UPI001604CC6F|nr:uncharacterized protein LOC118434938 isoform X3 [Folsomia candida]
MCKKKTTQQQTWGKHLQHTLVLLYSKLVVGFLDLLLIGYSYYNTDARDQAFLSAVVVCFVFSFLLVLGVVLEYVVVSDFFIRIEMVFHSAACLLLLGTDTFFLISILKHGKGENFGIRILAMMFGYLNSAVYGYLPWTLVKST